MKKLFLLAAAALTVFSACTKNEVVETPDQAISFANPVVSPVTKAVINQAFKDYPEDESFKVYGYHTSGQFTSWENGTLYMPGVPCSKSTEPEDGKYYWAPNTPYYWPKVGYLTFIAYSPADATGGTFGYDNSGLTIKDYTLPTEGNQYDLMFSDINKNNQACTTNNNNLEYTTGYEGYHGVDLKFNHALSQIVVNIKAEDNYNTTSNGTTTGTVIKVTKVSFSGVTGKGTFNQNLNLPSTTDPATDPAWTLSADANDVKTYNPYKTDQYNGGLANLTKDGVDAGNILFMIPQDFQTGTDGNKTDKIKLNIEYTIIPPGGTTAQVEQKQSFSLVREYRTSDSQTGESLYKWEMGNKYIYNIVIGLDEIHFAPQVETWVEYTATDITADEKTI